MKPEISKERRRTERIMVSLPVLIKGKESVDNCWEENTKLITVSRSGAGFYLKNECKIGRLVSLTMALPPRLRCYDLDEELYCVWGVVQYCTLTADDGEIVFHVGVAFIGKNAPPSYHEKPLQPYRIADMNEDGMWSVVESRTDCVKRRHARFWVSMDVLVSAHDDEKNLVTDEDAKTENVSFGGAAVVSRLKADVGDSISFDCVEHNFSAKAIVRNRQELDSIRTKLHLEFLNGHFPVEKISLLRVEDITDQNDE
jgi:hypothetical protein